jgi:hypothetical protein
MATGSPSTFYLPSGQQVTLPVVPTTYADEVAAPSASPALGSRVRATTLANDVTAGVAWLASRPFFVGYQGSAQSVPNATNTAISLDTEQIDNYSGHSDSVNLSRWYPPQSANISAGFHDYYLATGLVKLSSSSTGAVFIAGTRLTGGNFVEGVKIPSTAGHAVNMWTADIVEVAAATDYIELMTWQNSGAAVNTAVGGGTCSYAMHRWVGSNRWATQPLPGTPHTWAAGDQITAAATGASPAGGVKVPLNTELNSYLTFLLSPPVVKLTSGGTTQSIASSTTAWTSIQFPVKSIDNYGYWSSGANSKITVQRAGLHTIIGFAALDGIASQTGYVACRLSVNAGARFIPGMAVVPESAASSGGTRVAVCITDRFAANDTIELQVQQNSGSALTVTSGTTQAARLLAVWEAL